MLKASRWIIGGCGLAFIGIGLMHPFVHINELSGPDLRTRFDSIGPIALQGNQERAWDLFQGISLLMGVFSMTIGALLLVVLRATPKGQVPSAGVSLITIVTLFAVLWVGAVYLSALQVVGGGTGALLLLLPLVHSLRPQRQSS